jgi:hypothetical protein
MITYPSTVQTLPWTMLIRSKAKKLEAAAIMAINMYRAIRKMGLIAQVFSDTFI